MIPTEEPPPAVSLSLEGVQGWATAAEFSGSHSQAEGQTSELLLVLLLEPEVAVELRERRFWACSPSEPLSGRGEAPQCPDRALQPSLSQCRRAATRGTWERRAQEVRAARRGFRTPTVDRAGAI
ncbi:hypothetical protein SRHO_G00153090 [Serrasalmus rhombeus]